MQHDKTKEQSDKLKELAKKNAGNDVLAESINKKLVSLGKLVKK